MRLKWPFLLSIFLPSLMHADTPSLASQLKSIQEKYHLPALAGAIFTTDGVTEMAATGVRKTGTIMAATTDDRWHLGSNTKAMTATLLGYFVAEGKISWDAKVIIFFPEIATTIPSTMKDVTVGNILAHRAGLASNLDWMEFSKTGSLTEQRLKAAQVALKTPAYPPGSFHYSNTDYVVVGAILEKLSGKPWEELIMEQLFKPLSMNSAGFGGLGTVGAVDQPWPHDDQGKPEPSNGPLVDNPEILGPAGTVHCTMSDWAKFLSDQLRGATGMHALLPNGIYERIQTPNPQAEMTGGYYGYGWGICDRSWAGGKALQHAGSNTMNYCVCWLAPGKKFGVLV